MKINIKQEILILTILLGIFIFVRSVNYIYHLNFSGDQATQSAKILELWRLKKPTLLGNPVSSFTYEGRTIFQGPATYYMLAIFLLAAKFDPVVSSYLFLIFSGLMIFPLYFGVKWLINRKAAWLMVIFYVFLPFYINYTRFLWNPNFQFSLLPILVWLMGQYKQKQTDIIFFLISVFLAFLLQFHYQFIVVIGAILIYYFLFAKIHIRNILVFILGAVVGLSPMILFEIKNNFYNLQTLILILTHFDKVNKAGSTSTPHYWIAPTFFMTLAGLAIMRNKIAKIHTHWFMMLAIILFIWGAIRNFNRPSTAFWAPTSEWNYIAEKQIYENIKSTGISQDFNVVNLGYDNRAMVSRYFLIKDNYDTDFEEYYKNRYLFVVTEGDYYKITPAYEMRALGSFRELKSWKINRRFNMLLLERVTQVPEIKN